MSRGHSEPLSARIIRGLRSAGRPLTRVELSAWYVTGPKPAELQAELDLMIAAGYLVFAGKRPPSPNDWRREARSQPLYGLPDQVQIRA